MGKKRKFIIALFFMCLFLFPGVNVKANNLEDWMKYVTPPFRLDFRDCTSSTSCSKSITTDSSYMNGEVYQASINYDISMSNGGTGVFLTEYVPAMKKGFIYSATNYVCALEKGSTDGKPIRNWTATTLGSYSGNSIADTYSLATPNNSFHRSSIKLSNIPHAFQETDTINCYAMSDLFVSQVNGTYYGLRYGSTKTATISNFYFIGFEFEQLGQYTGDVAQEIKDYIDQADFGSATDVTSLKKSVDSLKAQIEESNAIQKETNEIAKDTNQTLKDTNQFLKDDDTSGAQTEADNFFSGFESDTHGLTAIVTAPLNFISSLTSSKCSPLGLNVPFLNNNQTLNLPCLSSIYTQYFGSALTIYQTITFGIVAYWVCVRILNMVKDFKDPEKDNIEVIDL